MPSLTQIIYVSTNGDRWVLITDQVGVHTVRHEANLSSGGHITQTPLADFLNVEGPGPEFEALRQLLSALEGRS